MMNGFLVDTSMSNLASTSNNEGNKSSKNNRNEDATHDAPQPPKKKRNLPGNPDPEGEIIALSPRTLLATNRFVCEICHKGFQREQNLQLHRRGHNLPWRLKQRSNKEVIKKKFYVCPEPSCVHHDPSRALGDLTGVKKHYCRKHGEKKWKCEKCSKRYAVQSDWKAHSKVCGTREYRCDCGTVFSRRDSFITHRAFCDALAQESARAVTPNTLLSSQPPGAGGGGGSGGSGSSTSGLFNFQNQLHTQGLQALQLKREQDFQQSLNLRPEIPPWLINSQTNNDHHLSFQTIMQPPPQHHDHLNHHHHHHNPNSTMPVAFPSFSPTASPHMSATALLQKAAEMGVTMSSKSCQTTAAAADASFRPHQPHHMTAAAAATVEFNSTSSGSGVVLSTREELGTSGLIHGLASFMNNNINNNKGAVTSSSSSLLSNTMCSFDQRSSAFEEISFNGMMNNNNSKNGDHHHNGNNNDGLTRDFLGLTAFPPHRDHFLTMAGLDQIGGTSSYNHHENHDQPPWQS